MRFHKPLDHILGTRLKVAVLRCLAVDGLELNGRQIALSIGASPKPVNQALVQLTREGVLLQRNVGRTHLFRLNSENPLAKDLIMPLFRREADLLNEALREAVRDIPGFLSAILYGSVARQKEEAFSDIDLLVVVENVTEAQAALEERAVSFLQRYGNILSFTVLSLTEFRRRYLEQDSFIHEVVSSGHVITGRLILELVYGPA